MFKNARNRASSNFPSYFLECLLYNVPSRHFSSRCDQTYYDVVNYLQKVSYETMVTWKCQNGVQSMFGDGQHQTHLTDAQELIRALVRLWDNWA